MLIEAGVAEGEVSGAAGGNKGNGTQVKVLGGGGGIGGALAC